MPPPIETVLLDALGEADAELALAVNAAQQAERERIAREDDSSAQIAELMRSNAEQRMQIKTLERQLAELKRQLECVDVKLAAKHASSAALTRGEGRPFWMGRSSSNDVTSPDKEYRSPPAADNGFEPLPTRLSLHMDAGTPRSRKIWPFSRGWSPARTPSKAQRSLHKRLVSGEV